MKLSFKNILPILLIFTLLILFAGCSLTPSTYTVTYNGNGNTSGVVPTDANLYEQGTLVTVLSKGNLVKISYSFVGWNTAANGSGTSQAAGSTFNMGTTNVTLYAQWTPYVLRDIGPAGGYIFYDKFSYSDGWRYLEAAPSDQSTDAEWGCDGTLIWGADGTLVGTGKQNTIDIEAGCTTSGTAADICANLSLGGYDDWFLPSKEELNLMHINLKVFGVGGFAVDYYWSSSEFNADNAWSQGFSGGGPLFISTKINTFRVRAVRAF